MPVGAIDTRPWGGCFIWSPAPLCIIPKPQGLNTLWRLWPSKTGAGDEVNPPPEAAVGLSTAFFSVVFGQQSQKRVVFSEYRPLHSVRKFRSKTLVFERPLLFLFHTNTINPWCVVNKQLIFVKFSPCFQDLHSIVSCQEAGQWLQFQQLQWQTYSSTHIITYTVGTHPAEQELDQSNPLAPNLLIASRPSLGAL